MQEVTLASLRVFDGASGRDPRTEARAYVLRALVAVLAHDILEAEYLHYDLSPEDSRLAVAAAKRILYSLRRQHRRASTPVLRSGPGGARGARSRPRPR